jgi:hypothetical protein
MFRYIHIILLSLIISGCIHISTSQLIRIDEPSPSIDELNIAFVGTFSYTPNVVTFDSDDNKWMLDTNQSLLYSEEFSGLIPKDRFVPFSEVHDVLLRRGKRDSSITILQSLLDFGISDTKVDVSGIGVPAQPKGEFVRNMNSIEALKSISDSTGAEHFAFVFFRPNYQLVQTGMVLTTSSMGMFLMGTILITDLSGNTVLTHSIHIKSQVALVKGAFGQEISKKGAIGLGTPDKNMWRLVSYNFKTILVPHIKPLLMNPLKKYSEEELQQQIYNLPFAPFLFLGKTNEVTVFWAPPYGRKDEIKGDVKLILRDDNSQIIKEVMPHKGAFKLGEIWTESEVNRLPFYFSILYGTGIESQEYSIRPPYN